MIKNRIFIVIAAGMLLMSLSVTGRAKDEVESLFIDLSESMQRLSEHSATISEKVLQAVVKIEVVGVAVNELNVNSERLVSRFQTTGSGFFIDSSGYIITNAHVVKDAQMIRINLPAYSDDSRSSSILKSRVKPLRAQLIGIDVETDLAVLKVDMPDSPFLEIADSDAIKPGNLIWTVGSPLGLSNTVTMGVVSTTARQLMPDSPMIFIQTDAAVNPGSSGGPLIDASGRVVGVNSSILSHSGGSDGISLAIPSNIMGSIYQKIREHGYVPRGDIGVNAQTITPELQFGLKLTQDWGVILSDVSSKAALSAGLHPGDIVVSMDGKVMENARQFIVNVYNKEIGSEVVLDVVRKGKPVSVRVEVKERRDAPSLFGVGTEVPIPHFGIFISNIDGENELAAKYKRGQGGVLVQAKMKNVAAQYPEIRTGDIIYSVNGLDIYNTNNFKKVVRGIEIGSPVVLHIERNRRLSYVTFYWN